MDKMLFGSEPHMVTLSSIGDSKNGYITVAEFGRSIPFEIKRVYWTYFTPHDVSRGFHAHKELKQVIFAVAGIIKFSVENKKGEVKDFFLDKPHEGIFLPPYTWREIKFSHNAVLLCLASEIYEEADYIRDYKLFKG